MYERLQVLNEQGQINHGQSIPFQDQELVSAYETMTLIRQFDQKAVALQRTGQLGTYPSCLGQEAFSTGIGMAMRDDDVLAPYYRDQAAQYLRGVKLHQLLQLWGGDERGNQFSGAAIQDLPVCVPIATQITHAAGIATAIKARSEHRAVVATCGEGATSRGDFYESMNLAGVWQLPLVIVVNNNQWAISVPRQLQTACESIAQKSVAAGIKGCVVDGNDVCAVYQACDEALQRARAGKGATLIEAVTYRLCDHTTADDASRYRSHEELKQAWEHEPLKRLQDFLHTQELWSAQQERALQQRIAEQIESAVSAYLENPDAPATDIIDYVYQECPAAMQEQRQQLSLKAQHAGGFAHGH